MLDQNNLYCSRETFAAFLSQEGFIEFADTMLQTEVDVPLLHANSTRGADESPAPMDMLFDSRAEREAAGSVFSLGGNNTKLTLLLDTWRQLRPTIMEVLVDKSPCPACGGKTVLNNGLLTFVPRRVYTYDDTDQTIDLVKNRTGDAYQIFSNL